MHFVASRAAGGRFIVVLDVSQTENAGSCLAMNNAEIMAHWCCRETIPQADKAQVPASDHPLAESWLPR